MPAAPAHPHQALRKRLSGMNIYLIGMMGAGKSSVGRPLAEALGYRFIDADEVIEAAAGRSIAAVFDTDGEEGFRQLETQVLGSIASWHSLVVATGGGVVTRPVNWGQLRQGVVVWLDAPEALLLERLAADPTPRPLMQGVDPSARLRELLQQRRPLYAEADLRVLQDGRAPRAVAEQLLAALPAVLKEPPQPPVAPMAADDRAEAEAPGNPAAPSGPAH
jgi:shikimate kinase